MGFEPTTCGLRNRCSTTELRQHWDKSTRTRPQMEFTKLPRGKQKFVTRCDATVDIDTIIFCEGRYEEFRRSSERSKKSRKAQCEEKPAGVFEAVRYIRPKEVEDSAQAKAGLGVPASRT